MNKSAHAVVAEIKPAIEQSAQSHYRDERAYRPGNPGHLQQIHQRRQNESDEDGNQQHHQHQLGDVAEEQDHGRSDDCLPHEDGGRRLRRAPPRMARPQRLRLLVLADFGLLFFLVALGGHTEAYRIRV